LYGECNKIAVSLSCHHYSLFIIHYALNMKVLFIIQGEGRGHLTQAVSLSRKLRREGCQLVGVMVGKSPSRQIPAFFFDKIGTEVLTFESPNFLPTPQNKRPKMIRSIAYNLLRFDKYLHSMLYIRRMIRETEADLVVNFYELLAGLSYAFFPPEARMVCVAHQYLFLHPSFHFPDEHPVALAMLKFFTRLTAIGASRKIALSFRHMPDHLAGDLFVVPPLLREEVFRLPSQQGDYLHGYMLNSGYSQEVVAWHDRHPDVPLHFFWDKQGVTEEVVIDKGLSFHPLSDEDFLRYLAGAKAYAGTAGFESVCEAMYLGKPVLMVPTHIEQACNAHDALRSGAGAVSADFNLDALLELSQTYQPNHAFKAWIEYGERQDFTSIFLPETQYLTPIPLLRKRLIFGHGLR
jgi:uncharacterized protein (TIGR00661 family)